MWLLCAHGAVLCLSQLALGSELCPYKCSESDPQMGISNWMVLCCMHVFSHSLFFSSTNIILNCMCRHIPGYWFFLQLILNYLHNWTVSVRWKFTSYFWMSLWPTALPGLKLLKWKKEILTKISIICRACLELQNMLYLISFQFSIWYAPNFYV